MFVAAVVSACFLSTASASLNFLLVGDWGGQDSKPYYTTGQMSSVTGMNKVAEAIGAEFVLGLGDNFYSNGVSKDNDPRFEESFESVYTGAIQNLPWYLVAGNHDHNGNVQAQIDYTATSSRWNFPSEFYVQSFTSTDGVKVDVVFIDTIDVTSSKNFEVPKGHPDYFKPLPEVPRSASETHWQWIEDQLSNSTAPYLFVAGHYPVYSVCEHGPTQTLITNLKPMLEKYGAHMVSGHDHCMSVVQETGSKVFHIVTGMGVECCYSASNLNKCPSGSVQWYVASGNAPKGVTAGFSSATATKTELTFKFYDQSGSELKSISIPPRNV